MSNNLHLVKLKQNPFVIYCQNKENESGGKNLKVVFQRAFDRAGAALKRIFQTSLVSFPPAPAALPLLC
jgi:hypothetical protein